MSADKAIAPVANVAVPVELRFVNDPAAGVVLPIAAGAAKLINALGITVVLNAGAAELPVALPNHDVAETFANATESTGVVLDVATEGVKNDGNVPVEKLVTVPEPAPVFVTVTLPVPPAGDTDIPVPATILLTPLEPPPPPANPAVGTSACAAGESKKLKANAKTYFFMI